MRYQELRQPLAGLNAWRITVILSMIALLGVFSIELFYGPQETGASALNVIEIAAILVLFIDLAVNFTRARSKKQFLRENWFELLLFVPFTAIFEAFRAYEVFEAMGIRALPFLMRTKILVDSGNTLAGLSQSEPVQVAKIAVIGLVGVQDRYKAMKYRGLLRF